MDTFLYGGEYWFLYVLFIMFVIYPLIIKTSNKTSKYLIEITFTILSLLKVKTNTLCMVPLLRYFIFFNTGYLLKETAIKYIDKNINIAIPLVLSLFSVLLFVLNIELDMRIIEMINVIIVIVATYMIINKKVFINIFERYGIYSLQIYCLNGFLLVLARTIICKLTSSPFIIIPFIVLICLCLSYIVIKHIIDKISIARVLLGLDN